MNRRHFIKKSSLASGLLLVPGFLKPLERFTFSPGQKKLVVIQLSGGNDWLNTVVPYKNDVYHRARPRLALKETQIIPLEKDLALNASLGALKEFYDQGEMTIVNNVGYPNPDRSHFRSMDIWQSASSSSQILHTGWLGRYLDNNCTGSFEAIETDDFLSLALRGKKLNGMAVKNIQQLQKETNTAYFRDLINATKGEILTEDNPLKKTNPKTPKTRDVLNADFTAKPFGESDRQSASPADDHVALLPPDWPGVWYSLPEGTVLV